MQVVYKYSFISKIYFTLPQLSTFTESQLNLPQPFLPLTKVLKISFKKYLALEENWSDKGETYLPFYEEIFVEKCKK